MNPTQTLPLASGGHPSPLNYLDELEWNEILQLTGDIAVAVIETIGRSPAAAKKKTC